MASKVVLVLVRGLANRAGTHALGPVEERALRGVLERALAAALEETVEDVDQETVDVIESVFEEWFADPHVQVELMGSVVENRRPSMTLLKERFENLDFDEETLPFELYEMTLAFQEGLNHELEAEVSQKDSALSNMLTHKRLETIFKAVKTPTKDAVDFGLGTLPRRPDLLVGREQDIEDLLELLKAKPTTSERAGPQTIAVVGLPGVGKTSLAAELCARRETFDLFPDGVLWASLGPSPDLLSIISGWSRSLDGPDLEQSSSVEEASLRLAAFLRGKKLLIVVDDLFEAKHGVPLKVLGEGAMLATSRAPAVARELTGQDSIHELQVLTEDEAVELLEKTTPSLAGEDPSLRRKLARELDGLPLTLRVAGGLLEEEIGYGWGIAELLENLRDGKRLLQSKAPADTGGLGVMVPPTVEVLLRTSFERLDTESRAGFRALGVMVAKPSTFDLEAAEAVWSSEDGRQEIRTLVRKGLLEKSGKGRFTMHPILLMFAGLLLAEDPVELYGAGKRHGQHFLGILARTKALYLDDALRASQLLEANWQDVRAGWSWAGSRHETDDEAARLCLGYADAGERWLFLHLPPEEHALWMQTATNSARCLGDVSAEAKNLVRLGNAYLRITKHEEAKECHEMALDKFRGLEDRTGEGRALANLGACLKEMGDLESAERCYREQLQITADTGDLPGEAASRSNLGVLYRDWGKYPDAIREVSAAITIFRRLGDRREEAGASANLGTIYYDQGNLDWAEQEQLKYLSMARELRDRESECRALSNLSNVHRARNEYEAAVRCSKKVLKLARELKNPRLEATGLGGMANALARLGRLEEARGLYEQQLRIVHFTVNPLGAAMVHNNLAMVLRRMGEPGEALRHINAALRRYRKISHPVGEASALWNAGLAFDQTGQRVRACEHLRQALSIYKKIGSPSARTVEDQLRSWQREGPC